MINYMNEIFTTVATAVRNQLPDVSVGGEYTRRPSSFPAITLDETRNITIGSLADSSNEEKFSRLTYRLQAFSNSQSGKKAEAREIFSAADAAMLAMGFRRITYTTTPEIYDSTIYSITATYEGVISANGVIYANE